MNHVFLIHLFDGADKLVQVDVYRALSLASRQAAKAVVSLRFRDRAIEPEFFEKEVQRVLDGQWKEPHKPCWYLCNDSIRARIEERLVIE